MASYIIAWWLKSFLLCYVSHAIERFSLKTVSFHLTESFLWWSWKYSESAIHTAILAAIILAQVIKVTCSLVPGSGCVWVACVGLFHIEKSLVDDINDDDLSRFLLYLIFAHGFLFSTPSATLCLSLSTYWVIFFNPLFLCVCFLGFFFVSIRIPVLR